MIKKTENLVKKKHTSDNPTKKTMGRSRSTQVERIEKLEEMVSMLLAFALRGHLLPSEREIVKQYITSRKRAKSVETSDGNDKTRCPVCRLPLSRPRAKRCPWCEVLLAEARKGLQQALENK